MKYFLLCLAQAAAISLAAPASASPFYPTEAAVFFSPNGGAENAIVQSIDSAKVRIRMQAFLFSNKEITQALIRAHQRGVKVDVIIDKKMPKKKPNTTEDLLKAGVPTFFDTAHRTAHDKIIIVDDQYRPHRKLQFRQSRRNQERGKPLNFEIQAARRRICQKLGEAFLSLRSGSVRKRERHRSASHKKSKLTHQFVNLDDVLLIKREEIS